MRALSSGFFGSKFRILFFILTALLFVGLFSSGTEVYAFDWGITVDIGSADDDPQGVVNTLQVLFIVSIIALAPSLIIMLTGFVRLIIVFSFTRMATATQQMPPNQVLVGIALILTIFLMTPMLTEINDNALIPFGAGELSLEEAIDAAMLPLRGFMFEQLSNRTGIETLELFHNLANQQMEDFETVPNHILIPAFVINEVAMGFMIGFMIYLPFIVIDMVVASVLMSMGMMMLPPAMISMPFKLMVFLLTGGWGRLIEEVMRTFNTL